MGKIGIGTLIGLACALAACGGSKKNSEASGPTPADTGCTPGARRCDGQKIQLCNADGSGELTEMTCARGLFCREEGKNAKCDTAACIAGRPLCDGSVATTCKADGTGPTSGGVDCNEADQLCSDGQCIDRYCESGEKICSGGDVYECDAEGKPSRLLYDCQGSNVCDGDVGVCRPKLCEPNTTSCDKSSAVQCNAFGTAFIESIDCSEQGLKCLAGSCDERVCEPIQRLCEDGNVYQCDQDGLGTTLSVTCGDDQHCESSAGGFAYCAPNECEPGEKRCVDNAVVVCDDDHSLSGPRELCDSDAFCDDGECVARGCADGELFCRDGEIYYCAYQAPPELYQECGAGRVCKQVAPSSAELGFNGAACVPLTCVAGETACLQNRVGVCGEDGESLSEITTDCSASDKVCTSDHQCSASVTDTIGSAESTDPVYAGYFIGSLIEVRSARRLTELQTWLIIAAPRSLRWVIYEQAGSAFVAKVDKLVNVAETTGFVSSGANSFNFTLEAGKIYALGVTSSADVYGYFDTAPFAGPLSFGVLRGRLNDAYSSTLYAANAYNSEAVPYMKAITELP